MNHPDPVKLAADLERCATFLRRRGGLALRLARDMQATASNGGGPSPKNAVSDPTGNAATANPNTEDARLRHAHDDLAFLLRQAHDIACAIPTKIADITANFDDRGRPIKPKLTKRQRLTPVCAEKFCEDDASPGRSGRCEACYRYRYDNATRNGVTLAEIGPVPEQVINARQQTRAQRIRINPITGEESVA